MMTTELEEKTVGNNFLNYNQEEKSTVEIVDNVQSINEEGGAFNSNTKTSELKIKEEADNIEKSIVSNVNVNNNNRIKINSLTNTATTNELTDSNNNNNNDDDSLYFMKLNEENCLLNKVTFFVCF